MSNIQKVFKFILGLILTTAGIGHLTWLRSDFLAQVPKWVPLDADLVVVLSGFVEIILGLSLMFWMQQAVLVGFVTALFFVAIFTGNISQYMNRIDAFGLNSDEARLIRLFFQPLLIWWALWSTGAISFFRKRSQSK